MAKEKTVEEDVVLAGDSRKNRKDGKKTPFEFWTADFGPIPSSDIDRILNIPSRDDMPGVFARAFFRDDAERIDYLRIEQRLRKFELWDEIEFIRKCLASTLGRMGFGKILQLQSKVELIAPSIVREQLSMRKVKGEDHIRGSDFRKEVVESKEPKGE